MHAGSKTPEVDTISHDAEPVKAELSPNLFVKEFRKSMARKESYEIIRDSLNVRRLWCECFTVAVFYASTKFVRTASGALKHSNHRMAF